MHTIEPFYNWRDQYTSETDPNSPFYGKNYNEFEFENLIYNYYIHPQWDGFGSPSLYVKIIFADYHRSCCILELMGEWNDAIHNDIMFLKKDVIEELQAAGIHKFLLLGENVLNFHASDSCYYDEWSEEVIEEGGWLIGINFRQHVIDEMASENVTNALLINERYDLPNWRNFNPKQLVELIESKIFLSIE